MEQGVEKRMSLTRIAITGPESTGKSQLAVELAAHYHTVWVPEVARTYLEKLDRPYTLDDVLNIAKEQERLEREMRSRATGLLFCDTELLVTKIWSEFKYGSCDPWILEQLVLQDFDLYLLCDIDLPWQEDPLREHPHRRKELFDLYLQEMQERKWPYRIVEGYGSARLDNALSHIESLLEGRI